MQNDRRIFIFILLPRPCCPAVENTLARFQPSSSTSVVAGMLMLVLVALGMLAVSF
ncbi:MAG: hypothetical protein ACK55I_08215 [bacterium]